MSTRWRSLTNDGTSQQAFGPVEWGLVGVVALIWGSTNFWIELALRSFSPGAIVLLRLVFGILTLSAIPSARRRRIPRSSWPRVAFLGVVWMAIPLALFPVAQQTITSSLAGLITGSLPLFAAVTAAFLLWRPPGLRVTAGLVVGFVGLLLVVLPYLGPTSLEGSLGGVAMAIVATACYGLSLNLAVPLQQRFGGPSVALRAELPALLAITFWLVAPWGALELSVGDLQPVAVVAVVVLGVANTGVAYVVMTTLLGRVGATRAGVSTYLNPCVAVLLGVLILNEPLHLASLAGLVLVLVGVGLSGGRGPAAQGSRQAAPGASVRDPVAGERAARD